MNQNTKKVSVEKILGYCFSVIGLVLLLLGIVFGVISYNFQQRAATVNGVIVDFSRSTLVEYTYDGESYQSWVSEYSSNWHIGDDIKLYVDKEQPHSAKTTALLYLPSIIFGILGGLFFAIGVVFLMIVMRRKRTKEQLLQTGRRIFAEVTGTRLMTTVTVGGRHPYKLECRYQDPLSGETYLFASECIRDDMQEYVGQQVAVYVDAANYKNYYMDLDSLPTMATVQIHDYR